MFVKEANGLPELKMISPLLTNMELVKCVSVHGGTSVYIVKSTKSNQSYYLKHICIPESQKQVDALMFTGAAATVEDAQNYYKQVAADYQAELETLEKLSASPNIGCYRSYQIEPKEDGVGFEIYLLAEYRQTLSEVLAETPMTQSGAVNLGVDLCSALCSLREAGLIHRNVKPSNVYLSSSGHYLLGDLGIAKIDELKYCSMPETMLSSFSAPELFSLLGTIEPTTDIYSVGMILYRIYNGNHGPFEDEKTSARAADKLRVTGEQLPAPMYADYEMADIVLKACAFKPEDRYQTPQELQEALLEYGKRNEASDALIVPPIQGEPEPIDPNAEEEVEPVQFADTEQMADDFKESFSPDTAMLNAIIDEVHRGSAGQDSIGLDENLQDASEDDETPDAAEAAEDDGELKINLPPRGQRRKKAKAAPRWLLPVLISAAALAAICAAVWFFIIVPSVTFVSSVTVTDIGSDYLTVQVESGEESGAFDVTCSDAYGNQSISYKNKDYEMTLIFEAVDKYTKNLSWTAHRLLIYTLMCGNRDGWRGNAADFNIADYMAWSGLASRDAAYRQLKKDVQSITNLKLTAESYKKYFESFYITHLATEANIKKYTGEVRISFAENVRHFLTQYYQLIPDWMGHLSENAYRMAFYLFYRARKAPVDDDGSFRVKIQDIIHYIGLPTKEDVKNRNYDEAIIRPFNKAVEEIEDVSGGSIHMDFDYDDINTFLGGKMNVGIDATMQSYIQQIEKNKTVKQLEAKKKPAKKPPQSTQ